jgi:hypothetical protein
MSAAVQNTVSATVPVPLCSTVSVLSVCLCPANMSAAVQNTVSATVPVPLCSTFSVPSVSVLLQCNTQCPLLRLSLSAPHSAYRLSLSCNTQCLLLRLSLSAPHSVYRLSLSCCSAIHSVCYCACPSLLHSQCTVCLCPVAVQYTVSATVPVHLCSTFSVLCLCPANKSATVQNTLSTTVTSLSAPQSVYRLSLSC